MILPEKIPVHVTFIMDGNGRWARQRGKERLEGHFEGVESVRSAMQTSVELGIKYVSFFAFSEENWNRPQPEVEGLMKLMLKAMKNEVPSFLDNGIKFRVIGNRARLSDEVNAGIDELENLTAGGERMTMILFMSYSGKWDILQAARRMAAAGSDEIEPPPPAFPTRIL